HELIDEAETTARVVARYSRESRIPLAVTRAAALHIVRIGEGRFTRPRIEIVDHVPRAELRAEIAIKPFVDRLQRLARNRFAEFALGRAGSKAIVPRLHRPAVVRLAPCVQD